ncbi:MAG: hypothetical protein JSR55_05105 [Proteobacteria bacterium]|nr:hypothetical protein [Pseudomonadota bacterium]
MSKPNKIIRITLFFANLSLGDAPWAIRPEAPTIDSRRYGKLRCALSRKVGNMARRSCRDHMPPKIDGLTLIKPLLAEDWNVITVSGISDRIQALEVDGDDYLTNLLRFSD